MSRQSKAELDEQEELADAQTDVEAQIEDELTMLDEAVLYGHIPGLSAFGFPDDYAAYVGPARNSKSEQDMSCSKEDWKEFLKKIEEDLSDD